MEMFISKTTNFDVAKIILGRSGYANISERTEKDTKEVVSVFVHTQEKIVVVLKAVEEKLKIFTAYYPSKFGNKYFIKIKEFPYNFFTDNKPIVEGEWRKMDYLKINLLTEKEQEIKGTVDFKVWQKKLNIKNKIILDKIGLDSYLVENETKKVSGF